MRSALADIDALILAGGLGSRLANVLNGLPKVLAPINGRPFLDYQLGYLAAEGVRKVVLGLGYGAQMVLEYLARTKLPLAVETVVEACPLGTAGAIALARPTLLSDPVLVLNGDTWLEIDLEEMLAAHRASPDALATLSCVVVDDARHYGSIELGTDGRIAAFIEKESSSSAGLINAGVYLLSARLLDALVVMLNLSLERDVLPHLPSKALHAYRVHDGNFLDIGTPESFGRAAAHLAARNIKLSGAVSV